VSLRFMLLCAHKADSWRRRLSQEGKVVSAPRGFCMLILTREVAGLPV